MGEELMKIIERYLEQKLGENIQIFSSKYLGGGCINNALKLETNVGGLFVKWNASCRSDLFLREAEGLIELSKAGADVLRIPKVLVAKEVNDTPGFLVQNYLAPSYSVGDTDEKLGRGLAIVHQFENSRFGFYNNNYCGATLQNNSWADNWIDFFVENRLRFLLRLIEKERPLPISEIGIYEKLMFRIPDLIPGDSCPVLIHGDLWSGNYMSTELGPALIDPAAYYADREMEFAIVTMFGGFSSRFFAAYNEVHPLDSDWRCRNRLYQLYHVLNHFLLFGGGYRQQALAIAREYI